MWRKKPTLVQQHNKNSKSRENATCKIYRHIKDNPDMIYRLLFLKTV